MRLRLNIFILFLIFTPYLHSNCSNSTSFWQQKVEKSASIEAFFLENQSCQKHFYKGLNTAQKIYFDTVLYSRKNISKEAYRNRWFSMLSVNDRDFFQRFTFFNNYFTKHKNKITSEELSCFQKQKSFTQAVGRDSFFAELKKRNMLNDTAYLYPLIRWAYVHNGIDMTLSRERVSKAEEVFSIQKGQVGDKEQFARFLALFKEEYDTVAFAMSQKLNISQIKAYKLLVIITYLESRGNIFAVSTTGAFGPTQLTLHYYMMYGEPSNPFSPKTSLIKLANKFIHYNRIGKSLNSSVVAYKSGSLSKCQNNINNSDVDCRYYNDYRRFMREMNHLNDKSAISRYLTGKSYFYPELNHLKRARNRRTLKDYEPYQYAVLKNGTLNQQAKRSLYLGGNYFNSLGKMKRSDIYKLQDKFGVRNIGVISDKKVCY